MIDTRTRGRDDARTRLACAVIGVVAAVAVLAVGFTGDDDGSGLAGGGGPGGSVPTQGGGTSIAGPSGAASTTAVPRITKAYLEAHFPFPPGARPAKEQPDHEIWYESSLSLQKIAAFYATALTRIDPALGCDITIEPYEGSGGKVVGGGCRFFEGSTLDLGHLQVRTGVENEPRGVALIQAYFDA